MRTCELKWVVDGRPTPDTNPAIGRVMCRERVEQHHGRGITFAASPWFNICEEHAKRLSEPGMENWVFECFTYEAVP